MPRGRGLDGRELLRNTPSLFNVRRNLAQDFFWDGRAATLEDAFLEAIESPVEMNMPSSALMRRLGGVPEYRRGLAEVYGPSGATARNVAKAIAAYVRAVARVEDTPFDRFGDDPSALSDSQQRGLKLFVGKARCLPCHTGIFFSDDYYHGVGVKIDPSRPDVGRYAVDPDPSWWRSFKTPPLRNVALTAPYMHDGSLKTLEDVIDFYDRGGDDPADRDPELVELKLSKAEKTDLVSFLRALNSRPAGDYGSAPGGGKGGP